MLSGVKKKWKEKLKKLLWNLVKKLEVLVFMLVGMITIPFLGVVFFRVLGLVIGIVVGFAVTAIALREVNRRYRQV